MWVGFFGSISCQPILHSSLRLNGICTIFQIWENTSSIFCNLCCSLEEKIFWITHSIRVCNSMRGDSNLFTFHFPGRLDKSGWGILLLTHIPNFCVPSITSFYFTCSPGLCGRIPYLFSATIGNSTRFLVWNTRIS